MKKILCYVVFLMSILVGADKIVPPPFDPYGMVNYSSADYYDISGHTLVYTDNNKIKHSIKTNGQYWHLRYPTKTKELHQKAREEIDAKLEGRDAKLLFSNKERTLYVEDNGTVKTYFDIYYGWSYEVRLYTYRDYFLTSGQAQVMSFEEGDTKAKELMYRAQFDGRHYYTLKIDILEGNGINISVQPDLEDAAIKIRYQAKLECNSKYYKSYAMYDLDPYKAVHQIDMKPINGKTKVKITLIKTDYEIPPLGIVSEKPGMFRLKNSLSTLPKMESVGYLFGDFSTVGDYLPNGDAVYWLNSAYWYFTKDNLRTNLVPILANHETIVDWPVYYEEMKRGTSVEGNISTKMAIYDASSKDNSSVRVNLSLSHLPKEMNLTKEDFSVFEDGNIEGKVRSLKRLHKPMNIVILLDSSGSMKKSMKLALRSVHHFIEKLPEDAKVTLVDFDTKVKPVKAKNRNEMLKKLLKIKANGATALYDSLIKGTQLLSGKSRASVILFTDGKDANYNDTKRGSKATFDMMIKEIQKNNIPVYPIAFGNGADTASLMTIANMTKTTYYQGDTEEKLNKIFDDIFHTLSSAYTLTYARGKTPKEGSQAVVNYMVDVSGSMDKRYTMFSKCDGCGYRLEPLKAMLAKSITALPEDTFIQLNTFASEVKTLQIMTQDKAKILAGIGALKIGGGTKIIDALKKGLALSKVLPSNRRYFIFTTDAAADAFKFTKDEKKELKATLLAFKRSGIQTFWLGMWENKKVVKHMQYLAKLSGGEAFVSSDIAKIKNKILSITQKIAENNVTSSHIGSVMLKVKKVDKKTGKILSAVGEKELDLPLLMEEKATKKMKDIAYNVKRFRADAKSYNESMADMIYGDDLPLKDVRVSKILSLVDDHNKTIQAKNSAVNIEIPKAYILNRVKGLDAGSSNEFLVLELNVSNILPSQKVAVFEDGSKHPSSWVNHDNENYKYIDAVPPYVIPNLKSHLFIRVNNSYEMPFYPLTWGLAKPLTPIDQFTLTIDGKSSKQGVLLFRIPNKPIKSLSLHFYDSAYGHIDIPIIGKMLRDKKELVKLPKKAREKLSDTFTLSLLSKTFSDVLANVKAAKESLFEVLDMQIDSKIDALLKLDPKKRFYLKISSDKGDWMLSPHAVTSRIPLGFYKHIALAPGSHNRVSLAFQVPEKLKDLPQSLVVELKGKDKEIALDLTKTTKPIKKQKVLAKATAEKIALAINGIHKIERLDGSRENMLLVDLTLNDEEDGSATRLHSMLLLSNTDHLNVQDRKAIMGENVAGKKGLGSFASSQKETKRSKAFVLVNAETSSRLLGCDNMVLDGYKKRCLVLFDLDGLDENKALYLLSPLFKDLKYKIDVKKIPKLKKEENYLLAKRVVLETSSYMVDVEKILKKIRHENIMKGKGTSRAVKRMVSLDSSKDLPQSITPLPISYVGAQKMASIKGVEDALKALKSITWVPSAYDRALYSSESMFTQGWGTEFEMVQYIYALLRSKNIKIKASYYPLTTKGKAKLTEMAHGIPLTLKSVPYLAWTEEGKKRSLVFPFMKSKEELSEYIDISDPSNNSPLSSKWAELRMKLYYERKKTDVSMQMGGIGAALSGNEKGKEKSEEILHGQFALNKVSNMPVDIWFGEGKDKNGKDILKLYLYGENGIEDHDIKLGGKIVPKKLQIELYDGTQYLDKYTFEFKKGQKVEDLFFTFAFASPDLSAETLKKMEEVRIKKFKNIKKINPLSQLQWVNRAKIYKFIGLQSKYEIHLQKVLNVEAKRNRTPRTIIALMEETSDKKLVSTLDLRNVFNDVYGDKNTTHSFNIMGGIFNAQVEAKVIPGGKGVFDFWNESKDLNLTMIFPSQKSSVINIFKQKKIDNKIINRLSNSDKIWLYPINKKKHIGWLEIDPVNYRIVSVYENGMYGATEQAEMEDLIDSASQYGLGFYAGIFFSGYAMLDSTLLIPDFCKAVKVAENTANNVACLVSVADAGKAFSGIGILGAGLGCAGLSNEGLAVGVGASMAGNKTVAGKALGGFLGFGNGFGNAVAMYFSEVKNKSDCK